MCGGVLLFPTQLKGMQEKQCSQTGKETNQFVLLFCPSSRIWFLVATRASTGAEHLLCHTTVSAQVLSFWPGLRRNLSSAELGGRGGCPQLPCSAEVVLAEGRAVAQLTLGLLCCPHSSGRQLRAGLANRPVWCKQGSAPGSSGSELRCLNRWLGYTPSVTERH